MPTFQGATIQKAIDAGLAALDVARDAVSVDVIQEGKPGFLGIGKKAAIVNLKVVQADPAPAPEPEPHLHIPHPHLPTRDDGPKRDDKTAIAMVQSYLEDITNALNVPTTITNERKRDQVWFQMSTDNEAFLIGKHGKIINAIQFLAQTEFNHYGRSKWTVMLNVGDYRERRQAAVTRLADREAREVLASGRTVYLDPMPSFERKAIHTALAKNDYVETHSEGSDPRRYVVITPRRNRI